MLALHLLQSALVHVNTLLVQQVLAEPAWASRLSDGAESLLAVHDLDQVAAGVVQDRCGDRAHLQRLLGEQDPELAQPVELRSYVLHGEGGGRDAVL
jgi:hypothetical protein